MFHCFPIFSHCFTSYSLIFSWSHIGASILLGIILPSPYSFHVFPRVFVRSIYPSISSIFQYFAMVLLDFSSVSNACPNAPSTIPTVAPYKQFCSFPPWIFSVLLLHSGHTSKLQFFHCFSIVSRVLYAIMVPHRSLNFTWHHLIILPSPYSFYRFSSRFNQFSKRSTQIFHCFPIFSIVLCQSPSFFPLFFSSFSPPFPFFPIVLCHIPSFFLLFFSSFSPPLQSAQIHLGGRTRGESIPQRHPIATWYITLKKFTWSTFFTTYFPHFCPFRGALPPDPLNSLCSQK